MESVTKNQEKAVDLFDRAFEVRLRYGKVVEYSAEFRHLLGVSSEGNEVLRQRLTLCCDGKLTWGV